MYSDFENMSQAFRANQAASDPDSKIDKRLEEVLYRPH